MVRLYSNKALVIDWSCQILQSFWFQFFLLSSYNSAYSQQAQQVAVAFKAIPNYSDSSDDCCHVPQTFVCLRKRCVWWGVLVLNLNHNNFLNIQPIFSSFNSDFYCICNLWIVLNWWCDFIELCIVKKAGLHASPFFHSWASSSAAASSS